MINRKRQRLILKRLGTHTNYWEDQVLGQQTLSKLCLHPLGPALKVLSRLAEKLATLRYQQTCCLPYPEYIQSISDDGNSKGKESKEFPWEIRLFTELNIAFHSNSVSIFSYTKVHLLIFQFLKKYLKGWIQLDLKAQAGPPLSGAWGKIC